MIKKIGVLFLLGTIFFIIGLSKYKTESYLIYDNCFTNMTKKECHLEKCRYFYHTSCLNFSKNCFYTSYEEYNKFSNSSCLIDNCLNAVLYEKDKCLKKDNIIFTIILFYTVFMISILYASYVVVKYNTERYYPI